MFSFSFTGLLIVLIAHSVASANTYKEYVNSSIGYCEDKSRYGRITLGSSGYDNKACEKIVCGRGVLVAYRCEPLSMSKQVQLQKDANLRREKDTTQTAARASSVNSQTEELKGFMP